MQLVKYRNRKVYNPEIKRYVTLNEILKALRDGDIVRVKDHKTGDNITRKVLTQAISEHLLSYNGNSEDYFTMTKEDVKLLLTSRITDILQ